MKLQVFTQFLTALRDEAEARLGGSFASGKEDEKPGFLSDIDLIIPYTPTTDEFGVRLHDRPINKAISVFERFGVPWESGLNGCINSPRDTFTLPRPVEVMEAAWIEAEAGIPETCEIYGVEFVTHHDESWGNEE